MNNVGKEISVKENKSERRENMKKEQIFGRLNKSLIVSVQSSEQNPLCTAEHMVLLAECSASAGCRNYRVDTPEHIEAIKKEIPDALLIGIWKMDYPDSDVFITPTMKEVDTLIACGVDILALDGTHGINPTGETTYTLIKEIKSRYPNVVLMADVATVADAVESQKAGVDIVSTTLRGYTADTKEFMGKDCDMDFIRELKRTISCFIVAEGKIWTREDAVKAFESGADAVVVGTAINNPKMITERFLKAVEKVS